MPKNVPENSFYKNSITGDRACTASIPTYERASFNYGNGGCDGFSPNFPLIQWRFSPFGTVLRIQYSILMSGVIRYRRMIA